MEDLMTYGLGIIVTMLGYFFHQMMQDLREIQKQHNNCKEQLPHNYVLKSDYARDQQQIKEDFKDDIAEIKSLIGKLFEKVEGRGSD